MAKVAVAGLKISTLETGAEAPWPPIMATAPSFRRTAAWRCRGLDMLPTTVKEPVEGSKSSALWRATLPFEPPERSTFPFARRVAV